MQHNDSVKYLREKKKEKKKGAIKFRQLMPGAIDLGGTVLL